MKIYKITAAVFAATFGFAAHAGSLHMPPQQVVTPPAKPLFSWAGPYVGIGAGTTRAKERRQTYDQRDVMGERPTWGERVEGVGDPYTKGDFVSDLGERNSCDQFDNAADQTFTFGADQPWAYAMKCGDLLDAARRGEWLDSGAFAEGGRPYEMGDVVEFQSGTEEYVTGQERYQTGTEAVNRDHSTVGVFAGYRWQSGASVVLGIEASYHRFNDENDWQVMGQVGLPIGTTNFALPYLLAGYDVTDSSVLYGAGLDFAVTDNWLLGVQGAYADKTDKSRMMARLAYKF